MIHRLLCFCGLWACLLLVGCDGYPADWARIDKPFFASCPDLAGTYSIGANSKDGVGRDAGMDDTLFRNILPPRTAQRWHWETMTISGDASSQLQVTLMRSQQTMDNYRDRLFAKGGKDYYRKQYENMYSPTVRWSGSFARMTDDEYAGNLDKLYLASVQQHVLKRGADYECRGGWLSGGRLEHDPGPDRNDPRPDKENGIVRFARDKQGNLVAESVYPEDMFFSVWCGDGCRGFSLGTWTQHKWRRWQAAAPAWQGEEQRPWAQPFRRENPWTESSDSSVLLRLGEVRQMLAPMVPAPAQIADLQVSGRDVVALVDSPVLTPYHRMFETVDRSYAFSRVEVAALERTASGGWRLSLQLGLKPRASVTPISSIESQVRALLPAGATFYSVTSSGSGFVVSARCLDRAMVSQFLRNIDTSPTFQKADLESLLIGPDNVHDVRVRFRER